jgi:hypothetical protein
MVPIKILRISNASNAEQSIENKMVSCVFAELCLYQEDSCNDFSINSESALNPIKGDAMGLRERASYGEAWWSDEMFIDLSGLARLE